MIRLHHCPQSRSMRTLWLLHELGVEFEVRTYAFDKSLRDPAYLQLSPAGRVPALEIGDLALFETGAITQVLCERFSPDGLGRTPDSPERAAWLVWVHFAETLSQHVAALTQQHIVLREDAMRSPIIMKLEAARVAKCFDAIERRLQGLSGAGGSYLLPSGFSAADVSVGQAVAMAQYFVTLEGHPVLADWFARLAARDGYQRSLPTEDLIYTQAFYPPWPVE